MLEDNLIQNVILLQTVLDEVCIIVAMIIMIIFLLYISGDFHVFTFKLFSRFNIKETGMK